MDYHQRGCGLQFNEQGSLWEFDLNLKSSFNSSSARLASEAACVQQSINIDRCHGTFSFLSRLPFHAFGPSMPAQLCLVWHLALQLRWHKPYRQCSSPSPVSLQLDETPQRCKGAVPRSLKNDRRKIIMSFSERFVHSLDM